LGIAQRQIHINFDRKEGKKKTYNPLPANIKTIGDWIQIKRIEKNLTRGHVAIKMGIAQRVVWSWERGASRPDNQQLKILVNLFGYDPKNEGAIPGQNRLPPAEYYSAASFMRRPLPWLTHLDP